MIESCLHSVLSQDIADAEILLIDNGSTDLTVQIAMQILNDRVNARVIVNESNLGRVGNWNRCLDEARGEFVKFAFTNDVLLPGAIQRLAKALENHPKAAHAGSRQKSVSSIPLHLPIVPNDAPLTVRSSGDSLEYLAKNGFAPLGSLNGMIYRRSAIVDSGLRFRSDIPYFADYFFALELAALGSTVFVDAETYLFNEGATGRYHYAGLKDIPKFLAEHRACTMRHMELLRAHGRPSRFALDYLRGRYFWYLGQGWNISPWDGWRTFRGFPRHQLEALARTAWFLLRKPSLGV